MEEEGEKQGSSPLCWDVHVGSSEKPVRGKAKSREASVSFPIEDSRKRQ